MGKSVRFTIPMTRSTVNEIHKDLATVQRNPHSRFPAPQHRPAFETLGVKRSRVLRSKMKQNKLRPVRTSDRPVRPGIYVAPGSRWRQLSTVDPASKPRTRFQAPLRTQHGLRPGGVNSVKRPSEQAAEPKPKGSRPAVSHAKLQVPARRKSGTLT